jgi:hypothetical protein
MEFKKLTNTSVEVTTPIIQVYDYKELLSRKQDLQFQINSYAAILQKEIDKIDLILGECTKLEITAEEPIEIIKEKI